MNEEGIVNICDTLGLAYGRPYTGSITRGPQISISCPIAISTHSDPYDGNMSCSVSIADGGPSKAYCHSGNCRFRGTFLRLIKMAVGLRGNTDELQELFRWVESVERVTLDGLYSQHLESMKKAAEARKALEEDRFVWPEERYSRFAGVVPREYVAKRGISVSSCRRWNLGWDRERGYLVVPMRRRDGKLVGMMGRSIKKDPKQRHHNYGGLDKAKYLFGAHLLEVGKPIVIVEGWIDAIRTDQALLGDACVVATLGEGFSQQHAKTIRDVGPPYVCIFTDGDRGGHAIGSKINYTLHGLVPMRLMECPWGPPVLDDTGKPIYGDDGKPARGKVDPSDLPAEYIQHLFRNAKPILGKIQWSDPPPLFDASKWKAV